MTQYAYFDSTQPAPQKVIGWYDTVLFTYVNLPPASDLLILTAAQWAECTATPSLWSVSNGAPVAYVPPVPVLTLAQQATGLLASGLAITSAATASLSATYPADPATISYINSECSAIVLNGEFADGTTSIQWPDTSGTLHGFTVPQFKTFAAALGAFVSGIRKCVIGVPGAALPPATATIP